MTISQPESPPKSGKPPSRDSAGRFLALDGARGLAILLVIVYHFGAHAAFNYPTALATLFKIGWVGVDLFFVLSGFLITDILLASKQLPHYFKNFYGRRILRIFPLYYAVLAVVFFFPSFLQKYLSINPLSHTKVLELAAYATNFVIAYYDSWHFAVFDPFWSLAVEEHFYLFWPAVILITPSRHLARVCIIFIIAAFASRCAFLAFSHNTLASNILTPCRMDSLAAGALLAVYRLSGISLKFILLTMAASLAGLLAILITRHTLDPWDPFMKTAGFSLIACFFFALIALLIAPTPIRSLNAAFSFPPLRTIGKYSYGMYVFHLPLIALIDRLAPPSKIQSIGKRPTNPIG